MIYEREHKKKCITITVDGYLTSIGLLEAFLIASSFISLTSNISLYFYFIRTSRAIAWNFTRYKIFWFYLHYFNIL